MRTAIRRSWGFCMVGENLNILSLAINNQVLAIKQTARSISATQLRIATGNRVNSPLDNPQNFFQAFSLSSEASKLNRVLDNIGQGILNLQSAGTSLTTLQDLVNLAETTAQDARSDLVANQQDLGTTILADNPVVYYRLDETVGTIAQNLGSGGATLNGTYQGGVSLDQGVLHFGLNSVSVSFDGVDDNVAIPNSVLINTDPAGYPERTVELTFQANSVTGRQVLFEEGGTGNAIALYLDNDRIYYAARDNGDFGPFDISAQIEAGVTYHAAFVLDSNAGTFTGYLNGEAVGSGVVTKPIAAHGGAVAIGRNAGGTFFHDGANGGNGEYFNGRIADFALYNSILTQNDLQARYDITQLAQAEVFQQQVSDIFAQITPLVQDSSFQGVNLLAGNDLRTSLNTSGSSSLLTEGRDLTLSGLNLQEPEFKTFVDIDSTLDGINIANNTLEIFGNSLSADLNILETRQNFTETTINTLEAGSDDLTVADLDEESANLLALQTQQEIQLSTLALSSNTINIGDFLVQNPFGLGSSAASLFS